MSVGSNFLITLAVSHIVLGFWSAPSTFYFNSCFVRVSRRLSSMNVARRSYNAYKILMPLSTVYKMPYCILQLFLNNDVARRCIHSRDLHT